MSQKQTPQKSHEWYLKNKYRYATYRENRKTGQTLHGPFDLRQLLIEEANQQFERFKSNIQVSETDCWLWQGHKTKNGYGVFHIKEKQWLAHRWIFIKTIGPIPDCLELDHRCRKRNCANPLHLEPVTRSENQRRGNNPLRLFSLLNICKKGHPLEGSNQMFDKRGYRRCRICYLVTQKSRVRNRSQLQKLKLTA